MQKNLTFKCKTLKTDTFSYVWPNLTKFLKILNVFLAVLLPNSAQNFMKVNSDSATKSLLEGLHSQIGRASIQV